MSRKRRSIGVVECLGPAVSVLVNDNDPAGARAIRRALQESTAAAGGRARAMGPFAASGEPGWYGLISCEGLDDGAIASVRSTAVAALEGHGYQAIATVRTAEPT